MKKPVQVEVCACTRCSMVGSEIAQDILLLQSRLMTKVNLSTILNLSSRPDLNEQGYKSPMYLSMASYLTMLILRHYAGSYSGYKD